MEFAFHLLVLVKNIHFFSQRMVKSLQVDVIMTFNLELPYYVSSFPLLILSNAEWKIIPRSNPIYFNASPWQQLFRHSIFEVIPKNFEPSVSI